MTLLDDLDALTDEAILIGHLVSGTNRDWLRHEMPALEDQTLPPGTTNQRAPRWQREERNFVIANSDTMTLGEIASVLGRNRHGVRYLRNKLALPTPTKSEETMTANQVGIALGIQGKAARGMFLDGTIPGRILPTSRGIAIISRRRFYQWAINPENWIYFYPARDRVTDPHLARLLELKAAKWGDRWITTKEAAEILGVTPPQISRQIEQGNIPAARPGAGYWLIKESVIRSEQLYVPRSHATRSNANFSPDQDSFIALCRAIGLSWATISNLYGTRRRTAFARLAPIWAPLIDEATAAAAAVEHLAARQRKAPNNAAAKVIDAAPALSLRDKQAALAQLAAAGVISSAESVRIGSQNGRTTHRWHRLHNNDLVDRLLASRPELADVKHYPEEKRLFADWRPHARRFPAICRAAARLKDGKPLSYHQRNLIRGIMSAWAAEYLAPNTPARKRLIKSLWLNGTVSRKSLDRYYATLKQYGIDPFAEKKGAC